MTCKLCHYAAKFHSYQERGVLTPHGEVRVRRAYYRCGRCPQGFIPYDDAVGLRDEVSPGFRPLVCLAGTLAPFAEAGEDVLKRLCGVRLSASTVLRVTEGEGERLRAQLKDGRMVKPEPAASKWTKPLGNQAPTAYVGLDAFSVPMQGVCGAKVEHRMLYTAVLYSPEKKHKRYLVDFELDVLAAQVRSQASAVGIEHVSELIAITDGGNGLEEALCRHLASDVTTILDWYHAAEHVCDFAKVWFAKDEVERVCWQTEAKGILYERGGVALMPVLQSLVSGPSPSAAATEELRKLIGYFGNNAHRTDYPSYRAKGWDIGSGPTESACKQIGVRLKGAGMRWAEDGAVTVAALRALYISGGELWDGFWSQSQALAC